MSIKIITKTYIMNNWMKVSVWLQEDGLPKYPCAECWRYGANNFLTGLSYTTISAILWADIGSVRPKMSGTKKHLVQKFLFSKFQFGRNYAIYILSSKTMLLGTFFKILPIKKKLTPIEIFPLKKFDI